MAQDAILTPEPTPTATLEPSATSTGTVESTATMPPSETTTLEPTVIPSETAIEGLTAEPTLTPEMEAPTSTPPEATLTPLPDVSTITTPEETVVTTRPDEWLSEPVLKSLIADTFDSSDLSLWSFEGPGWAFVPHDSGQALQAFNTHAAARLIQLDLLNVAAEMAVLLDYGSARLIVRQSPAGSYFVTLDRTGMVSLYRADVRIASAQVAPSTSDQWRVLRLSAIKGMLRVSVDGIEVITLRDESTLPPGVVGIAGVFDLTDQAQLPQNTLQVDDFRLYVPEAEIPVPSVSPLPASASAPLMISAPQAVSIFTVNSTADPGDGTCDVTECTLREAISAANANAGFTDTIAFNILDAGPHTIRPTSALPEITDPVIMDGQTEPDFAGTPIIELDGTNAGAGTNGLHISAGNSTVRGLVINKFSAAGIRLTGINPSTGGNSTITGNYIGTESNGSTAAPNGDGIQMCSSVSNRIGGTTAAERNVISGNAGNGIILCALPGRIPPLNNLIQGNYIGLTASGNAALGNGANGIYLQYGNGTVIGGTTSGAGNVISGNTNSGIFMIGGEHPDGPGMLPTPSVFSVTIQGNYIGTDHTGASAVPGQTEGINLNYTYFNTIGGSESGAGNVIAGNTGAGIQAVNGSRLTIEGNYIGTDPSGNLDLGNGGAGIDLSGSGNYIGGPQTGDGNVIAYNTNYGIVDRNVPFIYTDGNLIQGNRIFSNADAESAGLGLGIDLSQGGVTANDVGDMDTFQNYPVLTSAEVDDSILSIEGTLNSNPNTILRVEFFLNEVCDPSGSGEGQTYIGTTNVIADGSGNATISTNLSGTFSAGRFVTATATGSQNNTSEFSACAEIVEQTEDTPQIPPSLYVNTIADANDGVCSTGHCSLREAIIAANAHAVRSIITIPAGTYTLSITGIDEDNASTGDLDLRVAVTIQGAGANQTVINANAVDRVFEVFADASISDLTVRGGNITGNGGGIYIRQGDIRLEKVIIEHNSATTGGGISAREWGVIPLNLELIDSMVRFNEATTGGGVHITASSAMILDSTISENAADTVGGIALLSFIPDVINDVSISGSTIYGNEAEGIGGIDNSVSGQLSISNSTISGNHADTVGGAISTTNDAITTLNNVTITNNTVNNDGNDGTLGGGGLIAAQFGLIELNNTIVSGNTNVNGITTNCSDQRGQGEIVSKGHNLLGDMTGCSFVSDSSDVIGLIPLLGPLQDNGGPTWTHVLLNGSPAINTGDDTTCEMVDQRAIARPVGAHCDIGAFETSANPPTSQTDLALMLSDSPDPVLIGEDLTYTLTITNNGPTTASGVHIEQTLSAGLSFVSASFAEGGCQHVSGVVICDVAVLNNGASVQIPVVVNVGTAAVMLNSSAEVNANEVDTNEGNNTATASTTTQAPSTPPRPALTSPANNAVLSTALPELVWEDVSFGTRYIVQIDDDSRFRTPLELSITDPVYRVTSALTDSKYFWRVRAANALDALSSWSSVRIFTVDTTPPAVPGLLRPANNGAVTTARPQFSWKASPGAKRYQLQVSDTGTTVVIDTVVTKTSYTSPISLPQGTYEYQVRAIDAAGNESGFNPAFTFRVDLQRSPADQSATTDTTPRFQWYRFTDAVGYRLEVATDEDFNHPVTSFPIELSRTATSYTLPNISALPLNVYYWRLSVDTGAGFVAAPFYRTLIISPVFPKPPKLTSPANNFLTQMIPQLEWEVTTSTTGAPFAYQIQVDMDSRFRTPDQVVTTNDPFFIPSALADGKYYWRARTLNYLSAPGIWSKVQSFTLDTTAPVMTALTSPANGSSTTSTRPAFKWKATGNPVSFDVQIGIDAEPSSPLIMVAKANYTPNSALSATTYYWRVRARDKAGNLSEWSNVASFAIVSPNHAAPPLNFVGANDPLLSWTPVSWAFGYEVQIASRSDFRQTDYRNNTLTAGELTLTITTPLPNGTYYWRVRAKKSATLWGNWSSASTFVVER